MIKRDEKFIEKAKHAALEVLLHNKHGPYHGLPRTAGWGYPEPYTRDLLISSLGILTTKNEELIKSLKHVLETLAKNQSHLGHISSLVNDSQDRGSSDCTPLFLIGVGLWRKVMNEPDFLEDAVQKSLTWMQYRSPTNRIMVSQLPTSDWRDEQWVLGYGLFVNTLVYIYLRLFGLNERSELFKGQMTRLTVKGDRQNRHVHEGLVLRSKPYYALWSYKTYRSERFDLLGNSLAILSGIAKPSRTKKLITWIETECKTMRERGELAVDLPPNFFPYIKEGDPDWLPRYKKYNSPGEYHNGGIWPFVCGFYIAALVSAKRFKLARKKLLSLAKLIKQTREAKVEFGFNEWHRAQDGTPQGQDWQTWSAAMYLYAAECVEQKKTPFLEGIR
ncbi:MAG: amylo-alpha-1,6-glucosidase [Candidatus Omnitrophica bacterium]|nr:amylo-alpha-1,6-glucosidase [Candidatus Omnitrophota bacterium]MBU1047803.1 amylo-alpha-1,6-glucosidase [Candidatus Omnitrophota bacterium]MBU1631333.1 amylo-alpha-1,6-glucosidase [Candidatus Omnitrophota bacterium]MBU1767110.1 amylo-alpha-1,6-glucosidase [Candidatus Omnitrophota bacterium]MBU1888638.1 amylo-alpha-1,6-glucosidase [Candidatus Omnitrophota bacterium]